MTKLTNRQAESTLSDQIGILYWSQLGQQPRKITCQVFEDKLAIFLEDALTQPEQLLLAQGQVGLVRQIRDCLHEILQPRLKALISEVMTVTVSDLLVATQLDSGHVSFMAVLAPESATE